ncbi:hypothetical protein GALMADRAFT_1364564 [Galerina marginata CBS 339.88]|uniref:Uncharacterized protein n=1 Tax=Galerina marginata (strain CBS 339.88) TaxID=685588 RepID=A0A067THH7_GALM3|nr:hypothetical protein GALMADRAFT_1364564 [Galerina marginata CBS 339.88]
MPLPLRKHLPSSMHPQTPNPATPHQRSLEAKTTFPAPPSRPPSLPAHASPTPARRPESRFRVGRVKKESRTAGLPESPRDKAREGEGGDAVRVEGCHFKRRREGRVKSQEMRVFILGVWGVAEVVGQGGNGARGGDRGGRWEDGERLGVYAKFVDFCRARDFCFIFDSTEDCFFVFNHTWNFCLKKISTSVCRFLQKSRSELTVPTTQVPAETSSDSSFRVGKADD